MNTPEHSPSSNPYRAPALADSDLPGGDSLQNEGVVMALQSTRPWVLFLGILGMIGTGLMLLGGLGFIFFSLTSGRSGPFMGMGVAYFIGSIFYFIPSIFLVRYAKRIREFVIAPSGASLESALATQKSFWKFVGILTLIAMVLYAAVLFVSIFVGFASRS